MVAVIRFITVSHERNMQSTKLAEKCVHIKFLFIWTFFCIISKRSSFFSTFNVYVYEWENGFIFFAAERFGALGVLTCVVAVVALPRTPNGFPREKCVHILNTIANKIETHSLRGNRSLCVFGSVLFYMYRFVYRI